MGNGHDLYLSDNCNANNSSYSNLSNTYGKNQGGNTTSLAGSYNFVVDEIEVFEVIYKEWQNEAKIKLIFNWCISCVDLGEYCFFIYYKFK